MVAQLVAIWAAKPLALSLIPDEGNKFYYCDV